MLLPHEWSNVELRLFLSVPEVGRSMSFFTLFIPCSYYWLWPVFLFMNLGYYHIWVSLTLDIPCTYGYFVTIIIVSWLWSDLGYCLMKFALFWNFDPGCFPLSSSLLFPTNCGRYILWLCFRLSFLSGSLLFLGFHYFIELFGFVFWLYYGALINMFDIIFISLHPMTVWSLSHGI